jgi:hypothetical protein
MQKLMQKLRFFVAVFFASFLFFALTTPSYASFYRVDQTKCPVDDLAVENILQAVKNHDPDAIKSLSNCLKYNHKLIFQACLIDPSQLANSDEIFRGDENFVGRLVKVNPEILKYISSTLKGDANFFERMTYLSRNALKYGDDQLLNNRVFMERMIKSDEKNYIYASNRIKEIPEIAKEALSNDGTLLAFATPKIKDDRAMVKIAIASDLEAIQFASDRLQNDIEMRLIVGPKKPQISQDAFLKFLRKNYITEEKKRNIGLVIDKETKFFKKHRLIDRNYIAKWQRLFQFNSVELKENLHLITAESRNNPSRFNEDLKKYPGLVKKIRKFFLQRHTDEDTVDNLSLTYLWKIKDHPLTLAFNVYLLRDSHDIELGPEYVSITSLTAIVQKTKNDWKMTVVEAIFDNEIKADVAFDEGLKRYVLQDLYVTSKKDKNPKLLFRVEDKFIEYFELFGESNGGKYKMIYQADPLKKDEEIAEKNDGEKNIK